MPATTAASAALALSILLHPAVDPSPGLPTPGSPDTAPSSPTPGAPTPGAPESPSTPGADGPGPVQSTPHSNWTGPGTVPDPPAVTPGVAWTPPSYGSPYTPVLPQQLAPRPVRPVAPVIPPPDKIRVGNFVTDIPAGMSPADVRSINRWSAFTEAQVATTLVSIGVPRDEASRRAAATVLGAAGGAVTGAAVAGVPAAAVGGALGIVPGAIAGGIGGGIAAAPLGMMVAPVIPPAVTVPLGVVLGTGAGAVGGAAAGAALLGVPAALAGAAAGGLIGGALGYALGAGDPGGTPGPQPEAPGQQADPWKPKPANPDANQYELTVGEGAPTSVRYVVTSRGDVRGTVKVGPADVSFGWSAEQADAPYQAAGFLAQTARDSVSREVVNAGKRAEKALGDVVRIAYPQTTHARQDINAR